MKIARLAWIAYALAAVVVTLDQLSKAYVTALLDRMGRNSLEVLPFFHLTSVDNEGVSFGLFTAHGGPGRWILVLFSTVVVIGLVIWAARLTRIWTALAVGLIIGGAIGNNLIDRVRFGHVVDFLDFSRIGFIWVFNVADSAISVGVALLLLDSLLSPNKPDAKALS